MGRFILQDNYQYLQEILQMVVRFGSLFFIVLIADFLLYKAFCIKNKPDKPGEALQREKPLWIFLMLLTFTGSMFMIERR